MAAGTSRRERKVVTVVFCDLVGFTSRAESMDPEDVEALLRPYHSRVRAELERHGGTVEKFIGDAVMALFGAPTAHEDDPERAVRAALAIRDFALEEGLELRVGITTGEALVRLDAQPEAGEGMASGDVVNTAARLQSTAPVNGIVVDETTYRATRSAVDYQAAQPVDAKGKAEPIPIWKALAAHSRFGVDTAHEARSELVGRQRELGIVRDAFERARHERTPQLLTLVGVPGIGKSRMVYELFAGIVVPDPDLITWRQGRCLAYGDGITMWALGEIVKAQAGVLEQDAAEEIAAKIHRAVEDTLAGSGDEARVESHLLALLGLGAEAQLGGDRRNEAFAAWRRYLEGLAEQRPLVLVVEDIHWADESLLEFLDELVDWVSDVPLLVVATARPELLERRPDWGGGKLNATTLALSPLTDDETALLLGNLLGKPLLEADSQQALLERAGGNPLYAEQFAELFVERGSTDELPLPETLQGIIAARLDGLPESEKSLLQDAAVVGKVFWASSIGREPAAATASLHSLERKGFVRRQRRSSLEGESEFAFAHALVRDVSYGQIPRADRARRHRAVAEWLDDLGRPEDHAEMLAYHWSAALELVRASGGDDDEIVERARLALLAAGDRAFKLNSFAVAAAQYEDALALWPEGDPERPDLLFRLARALYNANDGRREESLETARDALLEVGETDRAAELQALLALVSWYRGQGELTRDRVSRAEDLAGTSVSASAARVLTVSARTREIAGDHEDGKRLGESALAMAESLGLQELAAHALTTIGMAKQGMGDRTGVADMERALEVALELETPIASGIAANLAIQFMFDGNLQRANPLWAESARLAERFGDEASLFFLSASRLWLAFAAGRWDEALEAADAVIEECETGSPHTNEWLVRIARGSIRDARGDAAGALADHLRGIEVAREIQNPVYLAETLAHCAATLAARGRPEQALVMLRELVSLTRDHGMCSGLAICGLFADELGITDELRAAVEQAPGPEFRGWQDAFLLVLAGDLRGAADRFAAMGNVTFEARQRLHAGERLLTGGQRAAGDVELRKALDFYRSVDAAYFVERGEALLAAAQSASA
jgi:class 3 adenylate cyclase/ATP/maltotriose-dependent transcriptional regulator MalT